MRHWLNVLRWVLGGATGLWLAVGCHTPSFQCLEGNECGESGQCEDTGFCSFPDAMCESGRRYEPNAGDGLMSRCVPVLEASASSDSTTGHDAAGNDSSTGRSGPGDDTSDDTSDGATTSPPANATDGPELPTIVIDRSMRFQTLDGMGIQAWDFPIDNANGWNWDSAEPAFYEVDIHYAQLITIFRDWETANDNDDPLTIDYTAMDPNGKIAAADIPMGEFLIGLGLEVNVQKVGLPTWMTGDDWEVPAAQYGEFAESVVSYQIHMEAAGVPQLDVDLWKVGDDNDAFKAPADAVAVAQEMLSSLAVHGLERQLITPSVPGSMADEWLAAWFGNPELLSATAAISIRGAATIDPGHFQALAGWSDDVGKPVWAYDNWYCGADQGCPSAPAEDSTTWASAWEMAQQNHRLIVGAHATRIYHAAMVGAQPSVDPRTGAKNPTFFLLQHFANWIPKDAVLLLALASDSTIFPTVVEHPDGTFGIIVLNTAPAQTDVEVRFEDGVASPVANAMQSVAGSYMNPQPAEPTDEGLRLTLAGHSITSLHFSVQ